MGVCKCKQRNVTNQFCYVCRMNVCESCMVKGHDRCIIKSYVHWLQDSDYSSTCSLCLEDIHVGEVIRLSCYDLFHWECLNSWALKFPETTPPSQYQCPDCKALLFPAAALVSPVADVVRQKFSTVGWGRRGLGLPPKDFGSTNRPSTPGERADGAYMSTSTPINSDNHAPPQIKTPFVPLPKRQQQQIAQQTAPSSYSRDYNESLRKVVDTRRTDEKINMSYDHDENKYQRKGITHWIGNLLRLTRPTDKTSGKSRRKLTFRRVIVALVIFALGFLTLIYFMSTVGRSIADSDPQLDPMLNKQIKVEDIQ